MRRTPSRLMRAAPPRIYGHARSEGTLMNIYTGIDVAALYIGREQLDGLMVDTQPAIGNGIHRRMIFNRTQIISNIHGRRDKVGFDSRLEFIEVPLVIAVCDRPQ